MAKNPKKAAASAATAAKAKAQGPAPKVRKHLQKAKGKSGGTLVVLIEDVPFVGKQGDQVEVKAGYARNYLLPNTLAVVPTAHNLALLEKYKIKVKQATEARIADLQGLADQIARLQRVTVEANSDENGHLYGSVGAQEISKALKGKNLFIEPDMVRLEEPIKECAVYPAVPLSLGYEIMAAIDVVVIPQVVGRK